MNNKKYSLIFNLYLCLALINVFYNIYVRLTSGVDYNELYIIYENLSKLSLLSVVFGILSVLIFISSIVFSVVFYKNKLSRDFGIYPLYNASWNIVWFFLIPTYLCFSNPRGCLNSLNYLYKSEFIFNIVELGLILYSLLKINNLMRTQIL